MSAHTFTPDPTIGAGPNPFAKRCTVCRQGRLLHDELPETMHCKCNGAERPCGYCQHMGH